MSERLIGVDVGASKIKAAVIDPRSGHVVSNLVHTDTPRSATPADVAATVAEVVSKLSCDGTIGVALPCVVRDGIARLAANLSPDWIGTDATELLTHELGRTVVVMNDADAAGLAEACFGAAKDRSGTVLMLTFGTGIGSAIVHEGQLVPNFELGHIELDGVVAEKLASANARIRDRLSWSDWSQRVNHVLEYLTMIVQPDLVVIGGGVSEPQRVPHWYPHIKADVDVVPATLGNCAGIVGAGLHAYGSNKEEGSRSA